MEVDNFMEHVFDSNSDEELTNKSKSELKKDRIKKTKRKKLSGTTPSTSADKEVEKKKKRKNKEVDVNPKKKLRKKENILVETPDSEDTPLTTALASSTKTEVREHKESLEQLRDKDESFYKFLKEHDADLLNFNESSGEEENEEDDDEDESEGDEDEEGDGSGNESDDEMEDMDVAEKTKISLKMIKAWKKELTKTTSKALVGDIIEGFRAAIERTGANTKSMKYSVDDSQVFGAMLKLCFSDLLSCWHIILRTEELPVAMVTYKNTKTEEYSKKSRKRGRFKALLKFYLCDIVKFLPEIQDAGVLAAALKQVLELAQFFGWFPRLARTALKELCRIWSRKKLESRKIAMVVILRVIETREDLIDVAIKRCYFAYVSNTKLVTEETWPVIRYMQDSFSKLCLVDPEATYRHAFLYIRQIAIHLRNATISSKKELVQTVYNWQSIQSLYMWERVLRDVPEDSLLAQLRYPLVQIILGVAGLVPTLTFYPLRYHCIRILLSAMENDDFFIPVFPLISQEMKDALVECLEELLVELVGKSAHSLAFPELILPTTLSLKNFCKKCKVAVYSKRFKALVEKIEEQSSYVNRIRNSEPADLADRDSVGVLSIKVRVGESPMKKYYESWKKLQERQRLIRLEERKKEEDKPDSGEECLDESDDENEFDWEDIDENKAFRGEEKETTKPSEKKSKPKKKPKVKLGKIDFGDEKIGDDVIQDLQLSDED